MFFGMILLPRYSKPINFPQQYFTEKLLKFSEANHPIVFMILHQAHLDS